MMTAVTDPTPLLDGKGRPLFLAIVFLMLALMTLDGVLTWLAAEDASTLIERVERRDGAIDDRGLILNGDQRAEIASDSNGDRLDRDLVNLKTWLAVIALIAAVSLTISAGPASSRRSLATMILIAGSAFFVPLLFYADTIDIVSTAHGG